MTQQSPWGTTPRRSIALFLCAVFFIFASFGFVGDCINMGRQPPLRFALSILISGLFSVGYAASGITLRSKFWIALIPLFTVHFLCMGLLSSALPDGPYRVQLNAAQTASLQARMLFNGIAIILSVTMGYIGLVYVSISESRRHLRAQLQTAALESEMAAAREVQRATMPEALPTIKNYVLDSIYRPAAEVGGDFFQIIPLQTGRNLVVIGDVSGKGLRAAMLVSMIVGILRTVSSFTEEPAAILGELNRRLTGRMNEGFATCLVARLEEHGTITLANAGHPAPYLNGREIAFSGSMPLGMIDDAVYQQTSVQMAAGDIAILLTDGVPEAQNAQRALFGFPRIESMLRDGATARHLAETAQHYGQNDDLTVISITRQS